MNKFISIVVVLVTFISVTAFAHEDALDYDKFVKEYYEAQVKTQQPNASKEDLEHYLSFLTEDVGYQHFPNAPDDSRESDGKKMMRKGMTYYLGSHSSYESKLIEYIVGYNSIALKHSYSGKGLRSDGSEFSYSTVALDVIELEDGKVSVIRRYGK